MTTVRPVAAKPANTVIRFSAVVLSRPVECRGIEESGEQSEQRQPRPNQIKPGHRSKVAIGGFSVHMPASHGCHGSHKKMKRQASRTITHFGNVEGSVVPI